MLEPITRLSKRQKIAHFVLIAMCSVMGSGVFAAAIRNGQGDLPIRFVGEQQQQPAIALKKVQPAVVAQAPLATPAPVKNEVELLQTVSDAPVPAAKPVSVSDVPARRGKLVWMEVTAYCHCKKCCGRNAKGITASGKPVSYNRGRFVAADPKRFDFGTKLSIPGYHDGRPVEVIDTGSAIKGRKLDVYFPSHEAAQEWGVRMLQVTVYDED